MGVNQLHQDKKQQQTEAHPPKAKDQQAISNNIKDKGNVPTKEDLWKNAEIKTFPDNSGWVVEMTGLDSKTHTVYARAVATADCKPSVHPVPSVRDVVDSVVDIAWKHVAKHIMETKQQQKDGGNDEEKDVASDEILKVDMDHWNQGAFPPAKRLLQLGAVWLVNETSYLQQAGKQQKHPHTKKKRLTTEEDGTRQPDWNDFVLRVHYAPDRFHAMDEVEWGKYCRGLLLGDNSVQVFLKGKALSPSEHVPLSGYPDKKDGVIVYEVNIVLCVDYWFYPAADPNKPFFHWIVLRILSQDAEHGFAVLNKPGTVPDHATVNNHSEDVLSAFSRVLREREKQAKEEGKDKIHDADPLCDHHHYRAAHVSLPLPLDTETQGLVILSTRRGFGAYLHELVEHAHGHLAKNEKQPQGVIKKYTCLVCIKRPEDMTVLNNLQESGAIVSHFYHHNPTHKNHTNFLDAIPKNENANTHEYGKCGIRLLKIGTNHGLYAANVTSDTSVGDAQLARRLWGLGVQNHSKTPAEDLGVSYVAQLEVEQVVHAAQLHTHLCNSSRLTPQQMICGQLAALGFPVVGDSIHGGGTSEAWKNRHGYNRLALQCCEWSFPQPEWSHPAVRESPTDSEKGTKKESPIENKVEESAGWTEVSKKQHHNNSNTNQRKGQQHEEQNGKRQLRASAGDRCVFRLNEAWWSPLLDQYHVGSI